MSYRLHVLSACVAILIAPALGGEESSSDVELAPLAERHPGLQNFFKLSNRIRSGGQPQGEAAFLELQRMGIRTIVSVDGARPDVEMARKHGLRYIHIPISYDGVSDEAKAALTRVVREATGPIYIHCHRGKHRGPAAAAVACVADGMEPGEAAIAILESAGTGKEYGGLWRDVRNFLPLAKDVPLPKLHEVAQVEPFVLAMASMESAFDRLDAIEKHGWPASTTEDLRERIEASTLIGEGFGEADRLAEGKYPPEMVDRLRESTKVAEQWREAVKAKDWPRAKEGWKSLQRECKSCHQTYRDSSLEVLKRDS